MDNQIINLYAKRMLTRHISEVVRAIHGIEVCASMIKNIAEINNLYKSLKSVY